MLPFFLISTKILPSIHLPRKAVPLSYSTIPILGCSLFDSLGQETFSTERKRVVFWAAFLLK